MDDPCRKARFRPPSSRSSPCEQLFGVEVRRLAVLVAFVFLQQGMMGFHDDTQKYQLLRDFFP